MGKHSKYNEQKKQYKSRMRSEHRQAALVYLDGECVKCGSVDKLEFDHINDDREDADHCISRMLDLNWDRLKTELNKCQLLCNPCHWDKTRADKNYGKSNHGTLTRYRGGCRCDICRLCHIAYLREYRHNKIKQKGY